MPSPTSRSRLSIADALARAAVLATIVGFVDLWLSVLSHAHELAAFPHIALPLAATTVLAFVVYLVAWLVAGAPLVRRLRLDAGAAAFAVAASTAALFTIVVLMGAEFSISNLFRYAIAATIALLLGPGAYAFAAAHGGARARGVGFALPWSAAVVLVFLWLEAYRVHAPASAASAGLMALAAVALVAVLVAGGRAGATPWPRRMALALFAVVVLGPLGARVGVKAHRSAVATAVRTPRHVFLIVIDTLRRDALSCYDTGGAPTPHIDALAADGVRFENAVSASSWTLPAVCSMMTGLATDVHGAIQYRQALHDSVETLADRLSGAGYRTAAIGSNPMLSPAYNVGQGFDTYDWYPRVSDDVSLGKWVLRRAFPGAFRRDLTTAELCDEAGKWTAAHRDESTFLWLHIFDPHHPYAPPQRFLPEGNAPPGMRTGFDDRKRIQAGTFAPGAPEREWIHRLYLGEVRYVDEQVGRFIDTLKAIGIYDDALIVLTSDHGEEFWDHEGFEHGHTLYRELLDVPLIVKVPGGGGGRSVSTLVPTRSVTPTVLALCDVPGDTTYVSRPLVPFLAGDAGTYVERPVLSGGLRYYADRESVTGARYKYIRNKVTGREQLFDLVNDPQERTPIEATNPEALAASRALLDAHVETVDRAQAYLGIEGGWQADLDRETIQRLKALGYL